MFDRPVESLIICPVESLIIFLFGVSCDLQTNPSVAPAQVRAGDGWSACRSDGSSGRRPPSTSPVAPFDF